MPARRLPRWLAFRSSRRADRNRGRPVLAHGDEQLHDVVRLQLRGLRLEHAVDLVKAFRCSFSCFGRHQPQARCHCEAPSGHAGAAAPAVASLQVQPPRRPQPRASGSCARRRAAAARCRPPPAARAPPGTRRRPCQSLVRALLRHIDRHDAHWALVREAHALLLGLPNDEPDRERLSCSSACFAIFSCSSIALAGVSAMIMARERPVAGAMRVVQEPQARPDLLRRLCQVQAGGLEGAARGEPSQSSSTLCSESHVMTTHLHSSWRKPHLPCDPFELSASMRRLRSREKARRQVTRITRQPPARAGSR
eukprot:tig00021589_g22745.t2